MTPHCLSFVLKISYRASCSSRLTLFCILSTVLSKSTCPEKYPSASSLMIF